MLGDEYGHLIALELGKDFGCLTLQRRNEFGAHGVILKWHSLTIKPRCGAVRLSLRVLCVSVVNFSSPCPPAPNSELSLPLRSWVQISSVERARQVGLLFSLFLLFLTEHYAMAKTREEISALAKPANFAPVVVQEVA